MGIRGTSGECVQISAPVAGRRVPFKGYQEKISSHWRRQMLGFISTAVQATLPDLPAILGRLRNLTHSQDKAMFASPISRSDGLLPRVQRCVKTNTRPRDPPNKENQDSRSIQPVTRECDLGDVRPSPSNSLISCSRLTLRRFPHLAHKVRDTAMMEARYGR